MNINTSLLTIMARTLLFTLSAFLFTLSFFGQNKIDNDALRSQITAYKNDIRGPYKDIRWFCTDGSIRAPKDPCPENIGPGVQHARFKADVVSLGKDHHLYFGQILSYTERTDFWDAENNQSRLKQYQLDKYLRSVDNGWIYQKAQYYRGSVQVEDEEAWGIAFYQWLLAKDEVLQQHFFLTRQSLKDVPHSGDDNIAQLMRSQSKVISDEYAPFMDLRTKIHSLPEVADIESVKKFQQKNASKLTADLNKKIEGLTKTMETFFTPINIQKLVKEAKILKNTPLGSALDNYAAYQASQVSVAQVIAETAELMLTIRDGILEEKRPLARLQLLDISLKLEEYLFKTAGEKPNYI